MSKEFLFRTISPSSRQNYGQGMFVPSNTKITPFINPEGTSLSSSYLPNLPIDPYLFSNLKQVHGNHGLSYLHPTQFGLPHNQQQHLLPSPIILPNKEQHIGSHVPASINPIIAPKGHIDPGMGGPGTYRHEYIVVDNNKDLAFAKDEMLQLRENGDSIAIGEYRTLLPDCRTQVVKYHTDGVNTGNVADVSYLGTPCPK